MNAATPASPSRPAVLIELDDAFWRDQLDRAEAYLGQVALVQAAFRAMAESVAEKVQQPQFHRFLRGIADDARRHEAAVTEFYRLLQKHELTPGHFQSQIADRDLSLPGDTAK